MPSVILATVFDMATGEILSQAEELSYRGPWERCKESEAEKQAQQQQQQFSQQLMSTYNEQFAEQQAILKTITPQLQATINNPQGFGVTEYAQLQAQIINDTGAQYSNAAKTAAAEFATTNEAGLPSGVEASIQANLAGAAAGQVSGESSQLIVSNAQLKAQQQQQAQAELTGIAANEGSQVESTGNSVNTGTAQAFQEASTIYNQGQVWQNILGGVVGGALGGAADTLTGGLATGITNSSNIFG